MITVNHLYQRNEAYILRHQMAEACILAVVQGGISILQLYFNIVRHKERSPVAQVFIEFGEIDMNAGQVEIAKMQVIIGNRKESVAQVIRLRIT